MYHSTLGLRVIKKKKKFMFQGVPLLEDVALADMNEVLPSLGLGFRV